MSRLVIIGSSNMDLTVKVKQIPLRGETVMAGDIVSAYGGKGANQAVAAKRFGSEAIFISKLGNDSYGTAIKKHFEEEGLPSEYLLTQNDVETGQAWICVQENGDNAIVVIPGANSQILPSDILKYREVIQSADYLLMQLEIPLESVETAARIAHESGVKVVLNPAPAQKLSDELLKCIYLITPNEHEAMLLTDNAEDPAAVLLEKGVENVIITLGEQGSVYRSKDRKHTVNALLVSAVDTVAAGDTYTGTLCAALCEGFSMEDAMELATKASAIAVTRVGAQSSIPYRHEII